MTAPAVVDLDHLDSGLRAWVEGLATSGPVLLRRDGQTIGTLTYSSAVLEGTIVPAGNKNAALPIVAACRSAPSIKTHDDEPLVCDPLRQQPASHGCRHHAAG